MFRETLIGCDEGEGPFEGAEGAETSTGETSTQRNDVFFVLVPRCVSSLIFFCPLGLLSSVCFSQKLCVEEFEGNDRRRRRR